MATKKLTVKVSKHERTIQLIKSKQNSINDLVSKALSNDKIDEEEFTFIMSELSKYNTLKSEIRVKSNKEYVKKNVTPDIQKMREEMRTEIIKQLTKPEK
jgi:hypothetical protein